MELSATTQQNSIARSEQYPLHKDYTALLNLAYERIAAYSGELWTNYNDSDPGITILQNLCYALTELGSKADTPIADILSSQGDRINYEDHFHTPLEILPINPVTKKDFCKTILNEITEIKQVYLSVNGTFLNGLVIRPYLELKPESISPGKPDQELEKAISKRVNQLLVQRSNLGQLFDTSKILSSVRLCFQGEIALEKNVTVEKVMAGIIFAINNLLSPYPVYKNYNQLAEQGRALPQLLEGPYLSGGYIEDDNIHSKRTSITLQEISATMLSLQGIERILLNNISLTEKDIASNRIEYGFETAPFVDADSFLSATILVANKPITAINRDKVQFYLQQLIPRPNECDLNEILPQGEYRNLRDYYSIQNSFPSVYRLIGKPPVNTAHQAKIKQLKAYLLLMEQYMADYVAQLSKVHQLFSFQSGRTSTELTSRTYFTQPLYQAPGIDGILHGVKGYASRLAATPSLTDWKAYQQDENNPYAQQLQGTASADADLSRKLRVLEHLLARCGKQFSHQPLQSINPRYGNDPIAEIEYLKQTLKKLPLLSSNRSRSYFKQNTFSSLACGLERNLENELDLRSYYVGVAECIQQSFLEKEGIEVYYYNSVGTRQIIFPPNASQVESEKIDQRKNRIEVIWNNLPLISFAQTQPPDSTEKLWNLLQVHTQLLTDLTKAYYGCVMIDCSRLMSFLRYNWILQGKEGKQLYQSEDVSLRNLVTMMSHLGDVTPLEIKSLNQNRGFEVGMTIASGAWAGFCLTDTHENALEIKMQLDNYRKGQSPGILSFSISKPGLIKKTYPIELIASKVVAFFPEWLSIFQQSHYRNLVFQTLIEFAPVSVIVDARSVSLDDMKKVMALYSNWMVILGKQYDGKELSLEDRIQSDQIAMELVDFIAETATNTIIPTTK
jgi:hypothetical protein